MTHLTKCASVWTEMKPAMDKLDKYPVFAGTPS